VCGAFCRLPGASGGGGWGRWWARGGGWRWGNGGLPASAGEGLGRFTGGVKQCIIGSYAVCDFRRVCVLCCFHLAPGA